MRKNIAVWNLACIQGGEKVSGFGIRLANDKRMFRFIFFNYNREDGALAGVGILWLAHILLSFSFNTFLNELKIDETVKSHFAAWIPAFAGMTDFISIRIRLNKEDFS